MFDEKDILPYGRFKYSQPYTGSKDGMRFKIVHPKPAEDEENLIYVETWPEPYCYEKTADELKKKTTFEYSEEGYESMISYLNAELETYSNH